MPQNPCTNSATNFADVSDQLCFVQTNLGAAIQSVASNIVLYGDLTSDILNDVESPSFGLEQINNKVITNQVLLQNSTYGLSALHSQVNGVDADVGAVANAIGHWVGGDPTVLSRLVGILAAIAAQNTPINDIDSHVGTSPAPADSVFGSLGRLIYTTAGGTIATTVADAVGQLIPYALAAVQQPKNPGTRFGSQIEWTPEAGATGIEIVMISVPPALGKTFDNSPAYLPYLCRIAPGSAFGWRPDELMQRVIYQSEPPASMITKFLLTPYPGVVLEVHDITAFGL